MSNYGSSQYKLPCQWVSCRGKHLPEKAVPGGEDRSGETLFVGRAMHSDDLIPGKIVRSRGFCYVSNDQYEYYYREYQALVCDRASLEWLPASYGGVPSGAIQGGRTSSGEPLYIGRALHNGKMTLGKVHPSLKCMFTPYDMKEHKYTEYEVLVCKTVNF